MGDNTEIEVNVAEVIDYLRLSGQFAPALADVVRRKVTANAAKKNGITISDEDLQKAADTFRIANRLNQASDTEEWLKSNGITLENLEQYLETNLLISKLKDKLEADADKEKYLSSKEIQENVREMIFEDWIVQELK